MHWSSKMQTEIALSSTEAEYIALSQAMREILPIMWLMEEARHQGVPVLNATPRVHCKVFEDNAGAIEIANVPKMRPRTKHLNIKYHHFREEVRKGTIASSPYLSPTQGRYLGSKKGHIDAKVMKFEICTHLVFRNTCLGSNFLFKFIFCYFSRVCVP